MTNGTALRTRYPFVFVLGVSSFAAAIAYVTNAFITGDTSGLDPWRSAALIMALILWTFPTIEANALARRREGRTATTFAASAFAFGFQWSIFMMLFGWDPDTAMTDWIVFGLTGAVFGSVMTRLAKPEQSQPAERFFEPGHVLDTTGLRPLLFKIWPFVSVAFITALILGAPPEGGWSPTYIPTQMIVFAALWPVPYVIAKPYQSAYLSSVGLGLVLMLAVLFVP